MKCPKCGELSSHTLAKEWMVKDGKRVIRFLYEPCGCLELKYEDGTPLKHEEVVKMERDYQ